MLKNNAKKIDHCILLTNKGVFELGFYFDGHTLACRYNQKTIIVFNKYSLAVKEYTVNQHGFIEYSSIRYVDDETVTVQREKVDSEFGVLMSDRTYYDILDHSNNFIHESQYIKFYKEKLKADLVKEMKDVVNVGGM